MFCTRCGRKLEEGEVCPCMKETGKGQPQTRPHIQLQKPQQGGVQGQPGAGPRNPYQSQPGPGPQGNPYQSQPGPGPQGNPYQGQQYQGNPYQGQPYQGQQQWRQPNAGQDQIVTEIKKFFRDILAVLKRPVSETQRLASENNMLSGLRFIIAKAVILLLVILITTKVVDNALNDWVPISMPYGTILFITLIATIGADCLEALLMKVFGGVFGEMTTMEGMFSAVGVRTIYDTIIALVTLLFSFIAPIFSLILYVVGMLLVPYVQYGGYRAAVQGDEDKKVYAFFVAKACATAVVAVLVYLIGLDAIMNTLSYAFRYL